MQRHLSLDYGAGVIGIGLTLILLIPTNAIIHAVADTTAVNAAFASR